MEHDRTLTYCPEDGRPCDGMCGVVETGHCHRENESPARQHQSTDPLAPYKERQRLDRHVEAALRRAGLVSVGDELPAWRAVEQAIAEMGWVIRRGEH